MIPGLLDGRGGDFFWLLKPRCYAQGHCTAGKLSITIPERSRGAVSDYHSLWAGETSSLKEVPEPGRPLCARSWQGAVTTSFTAIANSRTRVIRRPGHRWRMSLVLSFTITTFGASTK